MNQIIELEQQIKLPVQGDKIYSIDQEFLAVMYECYPLVDIERELIKMRAWLVANPSRRKTLRGMKRFINNWLSKAPEKEKGFIDKHTDKSWRNGL